MKFFLTIMLFILFTTSVYAENRAYLLEVFDLFDNKSQEITTGFSPDKYIRTHGGDQRVSVLIKATWMCYGDTSGFQKVCAMPPAVKPLFKKGDQVRVSLKKHITEGWTGMVELSLYREGIKSNVYGIRFKNRRNLYGRYYEKDLEKAPVAAEATASDQ